jgi:hypothetical protein
VSSDNYVLSYINSFEVTRLLLYAKYRILLRSYHGSYIDTDIIIIYRYHHHYYYLYMVNLLCRSTQQTTYR